MIQCTKSKFFYKPRNIIHAPHFSPSLTFHFFLHQGGAIYYINLACTPLLLSKISLTLHPTFHMHPTFYIIISLTTHFSPSLIYYSCTPISSCFCNLHPTFEVKHTKIIKSYLILTYLFHTSIIYIHITF